MVGESRRRGLDIGRSRGLAEWIVWYQALNAVSKACERPLVPFRLTLAQLHVLAVLQYEDRPLASGELARAMVRESQTMSDLIDRLRRRGLVRTRQDRQDRRKVPVNLTPAGRGTFAEAFRVASKVRESLFASLSNDDLRAARTAGEKLRAVALDQLGLSLEGL